MINEKDDLNGLENERHSAFIFLFYMLFLARQIEIQNWLHRDVTMLNLYVVIIYSGHFFTENIKV